jgi:hypothetical protein
MQKLGKGWVGSGEMDARVESSAKKSGLGIAAKLSSDLDRASFLR